MPYNAYYWCCHITEDCIWNMLYYHFTAKVMHYVTPLLLRAGRKPPSLLSKSCVALTTKCHNCLSNSFGQRLRQHRATQALCVWEGGWPLVERPDSKRRWPNSKQRLSEAALLRTASHSSLCVCIDNRVDHHRTSCEHEFRQTCF